jgi:hypothetical protein
MSIELPVLRLGLAGFSVEQKAELHAMLQRSAPGRYAWQIGPFKDADAWWLNGGRTQQVGDTTIRVTPGAPTDRSLLLNTPEIDRPLAFSLPLAFKPFEACHTFEPGSPRSINDVLEKFESWLQPIAAQFSLAARIMEHESVLGSGVYHVMLNGRLLAVVNMHGEIGVLSSAGPADFDDSMWARQPGTTQIPESFVRTTLSELMWQYAIRTTRDVLPKRYRTGMLYFRRPPRLPPGLLTDAHLLVIRELATAGSTFVDLQQRTGLGAAALARVLAALYLVGTVTANPKRAAVSQQFAATIHEVDPNPGANSVMPSGLDSEPGLNGHVSRRYGLSDFNASQPAPRR